MDRYGKDDERSMNMVEGEGTVEAGSEREHRLQGRGGVQDGGGWCHGLRGEHESIRFGFCQKSNQNFQFIVLQNSFGFSVIFGFSIFTHP